MNNQAHADIAELILARPNVTTDDLLRAVCHAVLAGYRPPLEMCHDAYADRNVTPDDSKPIPPQ